MAPPPPPPALGVALTRVQAQGLAGRVPLRVCRQTAASPGEP